MILHALMRSAARSRRTLVATVALGLALGTALVGLSAPAQADASPFVVTMTPSSSAPASGDQLTYTIDVSNSGGDITQDTVLNTQISGMTGLILTSNVGTCTQSNNAVHCEAGIMAGFSSWRVTIRGTVTAPNGATLFNGVTVTGNHESSGYETSVYSSVLVTNTTTIPKPDLRISIQGPSTIPDGPATMTYQLTVNNSGSVNAVDVRVVNTLPAGFAYASASGNSLFACQTAGLTMTCTGGRVNAGSNATITILANPGGQAVGSQLKDTAVVDPYDQIDEINELNNTGSLVSVSGADAVQSGLTITKTDDPLKDPLRPGDLLTYTITVKNIGTKDRADNIAMTDVTQGLDASSITATTTKGVCTVTAPKVTCTQKNPTLRLEALETMVVTIKGIVTSQAGTLITNTATVTGVIKNKAVTNTAMATTSVRPGVDLSVVMAAATNHFDGDDTPASKDPFRAYDDFQYDIAVGNSGLDDASNVLVRLVVAPDVKLLGDTLGNSCGQAGAGAVIICTLPAVQGSVSSLQDFGTVQNFSVFVVSPPHPGTINATVTVDPNNAIFEPDETNNVWSVNTPIVTGIDLTVSKSSDSPIAPSGTLEYTILVDNIGTEDATGVVVRDTLPAGTRFRSVVGDHNFTCSHDGSATGGDVECVGGRLLGTHDHQDPVPNPPFGDRATITLIVFAPAAPGLYKNQVRVDPAGAIPELLESNNINTFTTEVKIAGGLHAYHEFTIDKTQVAPVGPVVPSGIVEYDLKVDNLGTDVAFGVTVQDVMPAGTTFRFATDTLPGTGAFQCSEAGGTITCSGGTLDGSFDQTALVGDSTRTIHVSMFAPSQPGTYINRAVIDPNNNDPEADETNNSDQVVTTVALSGGGKYIDFDIASAQTGPVTGSPPVPVDVAPSGALQYTVTVTNNGSAVAFNVKVSDTLPTGSVFRSAQDVTGPASGKFICSESGGVVTCTGGTLDGASGPDETASPPTRQIVIEVFAPTQPGTYFNTAKVDPDHVIPEADETNNVATTSTNVRINGGGSFRDLVVSNITTSDSQPEPGQEYTYDVTVANTGSNPAYNVKLRNVLDDGATFVKANTTIGDSDPNDFTCGISGNVLTCDGGVLDGTDPADLDPHDTTAVIRITVRAPQRDGYTYGLTSRVDPDNTIPESNEGNNSRSLDVTVESEIDLTSTVSSSGTQGNAGSVTFTAHNGGTSKATDVLLVVQMPVGVIPQNLSQVEPGWSCQIEADPINKVTCHGNLDGGATATFKVDTYVTATSILSNAFVDPNNTIVESDDNNNASQG